MRGGAVGGGGGMEVTFMLTPNKGKVMPCNSGALRCSHIALGFCSLYYHFHWIL